MDERVKRDLRTQLHESRLPLILVPIAIGGMALVFLDTESAPPPSSTAIGLLVLGLVTVVWALHDRHYTFAAWALSLGLLSVTWLAWLWFPSSPTYWALVVPVAVTAATLEVRECLVAAGLATVILLIGPLLTPSVAISMQSMATAAATLWGTTYVLLISQSSEQQVMVSCWQRYEQARQSLEDARNRQLELNQALDDLALAHRQVLRLNEMLSAAQDAVDEARKAKEAFARNVSHELRTPLNMIIGFCDIILENPEAYSQRLPPRLLADIDAIMRNSEHLASLVDDVLELAEVETGHAQLVKARHSIREIANEAAQAVATLFRDKQLELILDIPLSLPLVFCDRTRIRQVMLNLLANAGRFTQEGAVKVQAARDKAMIVVSISDTGPGIDSAHIRHLFEPFQQGDPMMRRRYGGSGLGLAISKQFVELHAGKIWMESEIGVGTTVHFALPLDEISLEDTARRWFSPYDPHTPRSRLSLAPRVEVKPQLVIVEQDQTLRHLIDRYAEDLDLISVSTIKEARHAAKSNLPAGIVFNEQDAALAASMMADFPAMLFDTPVLSCWVPDRQPAITELGAQDYLVKPVTRADLMNSIKRTAPDARRFLLVDDDLETRQLFLRLLASIRQDYGVLQAGDGNEALALLRERTPDVLLLDLVMPIKDGFAVLEEKARDPRISQIPVIIITAKDRHREPIMSKTLTITRQGGLSARDLALSIRSVLRALQPRFGARAPSETPRQSQAYE